MLDPKLKKVLLRRKITEYDLKNYFYLLRKILFDNEKSLLDKIFYIVNRFIILKMLDKKRTISLKYYDKFIQAVFIKYSNDLLLEEANIKNWKEKFAVNNIVDYFFDKIPEEEFIKLDNYHKTEYSKKYIYLRYMQEEKISALYEKEIKIFFDINERDLELIKIGAISNIRKENVENLIDKIEISGNIARRYIGKLYDTDKELAFVLRGIADIIGWDALSKFLIVYHGINIELPRLDDVLDLKIKF